MEKVGHHDVFVQLRKTPPKRSLDGAPSRVKRARLSGPPALLRIRTSRSVEVRQRARLIRTVFKGLSVRKYFSWGNLEYCPTAALT